jgi:pyruvate kinase
MLDSMTDNSIPTRADTEAVYNAVITGCDAIMLSGKSSVGKYPAQAVSIMCEIVRVANGNTPKRVPRDFDSSNLDIPELVCHGACRIASALPHHDGAEGKIVDITVTGRSARMMSKFRPELPILAFSESVRTVRELALVYGVRAHYLPEIHDLPLEQRAIKAIWAAKTVGYLDENDKQVCVVAAYKNGATGDVHGFFTGVYDVASCLSVAKG